MKSKKGVSDIVITVSLILVAIVAVGVIAAFVVPMVKNQLGRTSACLALKDHFKINTASTASCYTENVDVKLSIQRGFEKEDAKGFAVQIRTSTGDIVSAREETNVVGKGNGTRYTYGITGKGKVEAVSISSILTNGDVCEGAEYSNIAPC